MQNVNGSKWSWLKQIARRAGFRLMRRPDGIIITSCEMWGVDAFDDLRRILAGDAVRTVFDIGANCGQTVLEFSRLFPEAEIHAFEPDPSTFAKLRQATSSHARIHSYCIGIGAEDAIATLHLADSSEGNSFLQLSDGRPGEWRSGWASQTGSATVPLRRLDSLCTENQIASIDLIKIDTQGFEGAVIAGGGKFLHKRNVRAILLEINFVPLYEGQADFSALYTALTQRDFHLVNLYNINRSPDGRLAWCDALFA